MNSLSQLAEKQASLRERQAQIKENKKQMGKNNRREVAKRLKEEIDKATDTQTVIELTSLLAKMQPKQRRQRKPVEEPKKSATIPKPTRTGSMVDNLSEEKRLIHDIVICAEQIILEAKRQSLPVPTDKQACEQAYSELAPAS